MTDRPILFSALMVRALLDGKKTQTRRSLSFSGYKDFTEFQPSATQGYDWAFRRADMCWVELRHEELLARLRFKVSDRLWVRESWQLHGRASDLCTVAYMASVNHAGWNEAHEQFPNALAGTMKARPFQEGWRPSIHMPRWASRITLTVTDVRVERLQDISAADCVAEGCAGGHDSIPGYPFSATPKEQYWQLWNSINGKDAWEQNPWVVALTFDVEQRNIDA